MMQFRKSRGESTALFGAVRLAARLEEATVGDRLTAEHLAEIFRANVDVLTISLSALTKDTEAVLDALDSLCGIPKLGYVLPPAVRTVRRTKEFARRPASKQRRSPVHS